MSDGVAQKIKFGAGLTVTDEGENVIRVDGAGAADGGGDTAYIHTQSALSSTWVINHGLGKNPSVTVVDTGGSVILPDVHYDSVNQVTLTFGAATSGKAYLN